MPKNVKQEFVYVVRGHSESGDDYLAVYKNEPSEAVLSELAHGWDGDDEGQGPGEDGSYVHISVDKEEVL
jgi:hypothetical protein